MKAYGLTEQQGKLLAFIKDRLANGVPPSFDEMKAHMGLKSKSGIHRLVAALEERGCIVRLAGRARAIALPTVERDAKAIAALLRIKKVALEATESTRGKSSALRDIVVYARSIVG